MKKSDFKLAFLKTKKRHYSAIVRFTSTALKTDTTEHYSLIILKKKKKKKARSHNYIIIISYSEQIFWHCGELHLLVFTHISLKQAIRD